MTFLKFTELLGSVLLLIGMFLLSADLPLYGFPILILSSLIWTIFCILLNLGYMFILHLALILIALNGFIVASMGA